MGRHTKWLYEQPHDEQMRILGLYNAERILEKKALEKLKKKKGRK